MQNDRVIGAKQSAPYILKLYRRNLRHFKVTIKTFFCIENLEHIVHNAYNVQGGGVVIIIYGACDMVISQIINGV